MCVSFHALKFPIAIDKKNEINKKGLKRSKRILSSDYTGIWLST